MKRTESIVLRLVLSLLLVSSLFQGCTVRWWFQPKQQVCPATPMTPDFDLWYKNISSDRNNSIWYALGRVSFDGGVKVDKRFTNELVRLLYLLEQNEGVCHRSKKEVK